MMKLWRIAAPVAFTMLFQYLFQSITTIFVGHLGDLQLSAVSLSHNVIGSISFGFLQGMTTALGTLCGQAYGAGQVGSLGIYMQRSWIILWIASIILSPVYIFAPPILKILGQEDHIAKLAGKYSMKIIPQMFSCAINFKDFGILSMIVIIISRDYFAIIFTNSEDMQRAVARLACLLAVALLLSSCAQVLTGVAIGGGWQVMVAYINLASYYLFGLPLAILLGFKANLGAMGLWVGIICGSALQILFLLIVTFRTNWDKEVEQTIKRIKKWGSQEIN